jgi:hypothetical protein
MAAAGLPQIPPTVSKNSSPRHVYDTERLSDVPTIQPVASGLKVKVPRALGSIVDRLFLYTFTVHVAVNRELEKKLRVEEGLMSACTISTINQLRD